MEDVIVFHVGDLADKEALVAGRWALLHHAALERLPRGAPRERDLGQLSRRELEEVITDAWLARAPNRLAKEYLGGE